MDAVRNLNHFGKLHLYRPYGFQKAFHAARGGVHYSRPFEIGEGELADIKALVTGNQQGKTFSGGKEVAFHATGLYPDWWDGWRFESPPKILVCGVNNDKTRDILQAELFGDPRDEKALGSGAIPKDRILETFRKPGIPNAFEAATVKHVNGVCRILFQGYDAKIGSFMGSGLDLIWGDEQMPEPVYHQFLRAIIATKGKIMMTFTPENGETETLYQLLHDLKDDQAVIRAGWDDAPHIANNPEAMARMAERWPAWQIPLRRDGEPLMGTGRVFDTPESEIWYEEKRIESHWKRGCAVDYGMDHPFAAVWGAYDEDNDIIWIYDAKRKSDMTLPEMASLVKKHGDLPVFYPHDMGKRESSSGKSYWQLFKAEGCWMYKQFTNPPGQGQKEGQGGIGKLPGIKEMEARFQSGRIRVAKHLIDWFEEYRNYHHKDGEIVDKRDDIMSATRYLVQMRRHFRNGERMSFTRDITYDNRAIV